MFLNLLVNAAQAIPAGNAEGNAIRITTTPGADQRVHICISDTGSGMPPEIRDRLFSPFFTTKASRRRDGLLGLSIRQRLVSSLGGEISVQTEVGRGTEFCVKLPPAPPQKQENPPPASVAAVVLGVRPRSPPKRRGRVLFVDDEVAIGNIAKLIIRGRTTPLQSASRRARWRCSSRVSASTSSSATS